MSYENTEASVEKLNEELQFFYDRGEPLMIEAHKRASFEVVSFEPFSYIKFGRFFPHAPRLEGRLALKGMVTQPHPVRGLRLYGLVPFETKVLGLEFDARDKEDRLTVNSVAMRLGHNSPNFRAA